MANVTLARLGEFLFGCAIGVAPFAAICAASPDLAIWDPRDIPVSLLGIALMCAAGNVVAGVWVLPLLVYPAWRELDRAVLLPRMRVKRSAAKWRQ